MGIPSQLKELVSEIPDHAQFIKRHGYLLDLVIFGFEKDIMHVLFQFFDAKHHCFTFPDYQLVSTLEEFSKLFGIPILDQNPFTCLEKALKYEDIASTLHIKLSDIVATWETRSRDKGLLAKFLIKIAREF